MTTMPYALARNRVVITTDVTDVLLSRSTELLPTNLVAEGTLRADLDQAYLQIAQSLSGFETAAAEAEALLASEGYVVLDCRSIVEACDREQALHLMTVVLTVIGIPLRVFNLWPLWKPLGVELDKEPIRSMGTGYNPLHIDLVNATLPPDYSALLCVRPDPLGGGYSLVANLRSALANLDPEAVALLREPVFRDGKFFELSGVGEEYAPFPVIDGIRPETGFVRFTAKMLAERDPDSPHTRAVHRLEQELIAAQQRFRLESGDLIVINQHVACHGREALGAGQAGLPEEQRRLMLQMFLRQRTGAGVD